MRFRYVVIGRDGNTLTTDWAPICDGIREAQQMMEYIMGYPCWIEYSVGVK